MSLSGALSNAMSGLAANARSTTIISSNIANALNENYGRRSISLVTDANQSSGGVRVSAVSRQSDPVLAHQQRLAAAELGKSEVFAGYAAGLEQLWGSVDTITSVAQQMTRFEASLVSAASDPSSDTRLRTLALDAEAFAASIRAASDGLQQIRSRADAQIADLVGEMNAGLKRIEGLNAKIATAKHHGRDALGFMDQRDSELHRLSGIVPFHVIERETGDVALFTLQGKTLLDGSAAEFGFDAHPLVQPHMTLANGLLSGLRLNGDPVTTSGAGAIAGGALAAQFEIRDASAVDAQSRLDAIARDVIERFGPAGHDPTILPGSAGVFTDDGAPFSALNEPGISARLSLHGDLMSNSTTLWRWRDGLYASGPGETGRSDVLLAAKARIVAPMVPGNPTIGTAAKTLVDHVQGLSSELSAQRVRRQDDAGFASSQYSALKEQTAQAGVNSDEELQKLIELEKSYAANARVLRVVDDMLSELLRI